MSTGQIDWSKSHEREADHRITRSPRQGRGMGTDSDDDIPVREPPARMCDLGEWMVVLTSSRAVCKRKGKNSDEVFDQDSEEIHRYKM